MKLRIKGNSLRIRVGPTELVGFLRTGKLKDTVHFGSAPDAKLTYALEISTANTTETHVRFRNQEVTVFLVANQALQWSKDDEIGIYTEVPLGTGAVLDITVEEDFACLDGGDDENEDTFRNPNAGSACQVA